jgi:hypothetical protein
MEVWEKINGAIAENEQIEIVLLYTALSANFFIS